MNKVFEQAVLVLDKIYSVVVDRRAFLQVLMLLITFGVLPITADQADAANQQLVDTLVLVSQAVSSIGGLLALMWSWTGRPPSGTMGVKDPYAVGSVGGSSEIEATVNEYLMSHPEHLKMAILEIVAALRLDDES